MLSIGLALTSPVVLRRAASPLAIALSWSEMIVLWHAAHGVSLSGTQTTAWADRKHGFVAEQAMGSRRPVLDVDGFGGAPGIAYDGGDDYLACTDPDLLAMLPTGNTPCEIWTLVQQAALPADTSQRMAVAYGSNAFDTQRRVRRSVVGGINRGTAQTGAGGGVAPTPTDATVDLSSRHVLRGTFGNSSVGIEVDGGAATNNGGVASATGATRVVLGATAADFPGNHWLGMQCVIAISHPLPADKKAVFQSTLMEMGNI